MEWNRLRRVSLRDLYHDVWGSAGGSHVDLKVFPKIARSTSLPRMVSFFRTQIINGRLLNAVQRQMHPERFHPKSIVIEPTFSCNLDCDRCYAPRRDVTMKRGVFEAIVSQAEALGIYRFVLMGGEPTLPEARAMYTPVIKEHPDCFFGICTNGTLVDDDYLATYSGINNIGLLLSIEGNRESTDRRRGEGVYDKVKAGVVRTREAGIPMALSVTLTAESWHKEISDEVVREFAEAGGIVFYTHVIVDNEKREQEEVDRVGLLLRLQEICKRYTLFVTDGQYGKMSPSGIVPRDFSQVCVDPEGTVRPFRFYYEPTVASILDKPLREILADPELMRIKNEARVHSNAELADVAGELEGRGFHVFPHARTCD